MSHLKLEVRPWDNQPQGRRFLDLELSPELWLAELLLLLLEFVLSEAGLSMTSGAPWGTHDVLAGGEYARL